MEDAVRADIRAPRRSSRSARKIQQRFNQRARVAADVFADANTIDAVCCFATPNRARSSSPDGFSAAHVIRAVTSERQLQEVHDRLLGESLQRLHWKEPESLLDWSTIATSFVRAHSGSFAICWARSQEPQMLLLPRQLAEQRRQHHPNIVENARGATKSAAYDSATRAFATLPRRRPPAPTRTRREPMELQRSASPAGIREGRAGSCAGTHWLDDRSAATRRGIRLSTRVARCRRGDRSRSHAGGGPRNRGGEDVLECSRAHRYGVLHPTKLARNFVSDDPPPALADRCERRSRRPTVTFARRYAVRRVSRCSAAPRNAAK